MCFCDLLKYTPKHGSHVFLSWCHQICLYDFGLWAKPFKQYRLFQIDISVSLKFYLERNVICHHRFLLKFDPYLCKSPCNIIALTDWILIFYIIYLHFNSKTNLPNYYLTYLAEGRRVGNRNTSNNTIHIDWFAIRVETVIQSAFFATSIHITTFYTY